MHKRLQSVLLLVEMGGGGGGGNMSLHLLVCAQKVWKDTQTRADCR